MTVGVMIDGGQKGCRSSYRLQVLRTTARRLPEKGLKLVELLILNTSKFYERIKL